MKSSKIALVHDFFLYRWGAERYNLMMARALSADLYTAFFSKEGKWLLEEMPLSTRSHAFAREEIGWGIVWLRQLYLLFAFLFSTRFLRDYETVILSNDALSSIRNVDPGARVIYFAHSLPRYLFDRREEYYQKVPKLLRPPYRLVRSYFDWAFFRSLARVDEIWTNSRQLAEQIEHYTHRSAHILYPPVDQAYFADTGAVYDPGFPYFLSFSKLSYFKRIDRVVEAFALRSDLHLILIYGDRDPDKDAILSLARDCPNIHPVRLEDNSLLPSYIRWAIATIFIPQNEDFGMVAIESLSCGTPVIGVDEWWLRETIHDGVNGILIPEWASLHDLDRALTQMTESRESYAKKSRSSVERFGLDMFTRELGGIMGW